ncbi:MAG TPA: SRPBCC domain-containing protein [Trebonia sp.]|nr:SRPBCC domain-containing protein [Trebonia sp.]
MKIGSTLTIPAEPNRVFERFLDPDTMRACIPGCAELERLDDKHYRGLLVNEVAHVRFSASFAAEITEIQPPGLVRAVLTGEDRKLASSLKVNATLQVAPDGDKSQVTYEMDIALWGKLGRLGEPIVRRRSVEVERQFAAAFADAVLGKVPAAAPAAGAGAAKHVAAANGAAPDDASAVAVAERPGPDQAAPSPASKAPAPGRAGKPRFWRNILADILEHLAGKLR